MNASTIQSRWINFCSTLAQASSVQRVGKRRRSESSMALRGTEACELRLLMTVSPTNVNASATGPTSATLTWDAVIDATEYFIERKLSEQPVSAFIQIAWLGSTTTHNDSVSHLSPNTSFDYRIRAKANGEMSDYSAIVSVTTPTTPNLDDAAVSSLVNKVGGWLESLQFDTSNSANGGIRLHQGVGAYDDGHPLNVVQPYFASLAMIGLAESTYANKLSVVGNAIRWHLSHLESDGTIQDHWYRADGTLPVSLPAKTPSDSSPGSTDTSNDSNSSTALMMIDAYLRAGGDIAFLNTSENRARIDSIVESLVRLQQANGLTWAKTSWHAMYTQDNSETYGGFIAARNIEKALANRPEKVAEYQTRALMTRHGLLTESFDTSTGRFRWVDNAFSQNTADLSDWYPRSVPVVWPTLFNVIAPESVVAKAQFSAIDGVWNGVLKTNWTTMADDASIGLAALLDGSREKALTHLSNVAKTHFDSATTPAAPFYPFTAAMGGFALRMLTPQLPSMNLSTPVGATHSGQFQGHDLLGRALSYTVTAQPQNGSLTVNSQTGAYQYTPNANFVGTDFFSIRVADETDLLRTSSNQTFSIDVSGEPVGFGSLSSIQAIVPLYQYPLSAPGVLSNWWQRVLNEASASHPITVIINPQNGPIDPAVGGADYNNYIEALRQLRANPNIRILGYVATGYGAVDSATVLEKASWYASGYKHPVTGNSLIDGIFLDEMSTNSAHVSQYTAIATGIRQISGLAGRFITGNPGVEIPGEFLDAGVADLFIIREGNLANFTSTALPSYVTANAYSHLQFGAIVHSTTSSSQVAKALREFKLRGLDFGFITDDLMPNPFDAAPTYFEDLLRDLHSPYVQTVSVNLPENSLLGTVVHNLVGGDPDVGQSVTYSIVSGNTLNAFQIDANTGQITVKTPAALNYEQSTIVWNLVVRATDNGSPSQFDEVPVVINLTNVNEAPVWSGPTEFSFEEFSPRWTMIGKLNATDPDGDSLRYSFVSGNPDNTLYLGDGSAPADGGRLWVYQQDLTGLRHRGMFNLKVRVTDSSAPSLSTDLDVKVYITGAGVISRADPSVDGSVLDATGDGFDVSDTVNSAGTGMLVQGGTNPSRGVLEFDLSNLPTNRVLKNAWLFFSTSALVGGATVSVPLDIYGYSGNGTIETGDAALGTKIGTRPINNADGSNQLKVHSAPLDAAFVRGLIGTGKLGLVFRNDGTSDGVVINTSEASVSAGQKPYLALQFSDLKPDLLVRDAGTGNSANQLLTLTSNGTSFTINTATVFGAGTWDRFLTGDFNGDGRGDVVARNADGTWWVSLTDINKQPQAASSWGSWATGTTWGDYQVADFDADGKADLAARNTAGEWWVWRSTGSALDPKLWGTWDNGTTWSNVVSADFNRDGRADIAGRNSLGQWFVARSTGTTPATNGFASTQWGLWSTSTVWSDVQIGDFNGDGRADIAGRSTIGQWWVNRSTGTSFSAALFYGNWSTGTTWNDVRMADFNGDGRDDIIGRSTIGQWWVAEVGTSGFVMKHLGNWSGPQTKWSEVTVGDFNRDGRADLVARNNAFNEIWTSLWSMNGSTVQFVTSLWTVLPDPANHMWRLLAGI